MSKPWLRHPLRTFYWRSRMRGKIKLTIDVGKSVPIDQEMKREQKRLVRELLADKKLSDMSAFNVKSNGRKV